jgi:hypothetical protein
LCGFVFSIVLWGQTDGPAVVRNTCLPCHNNTLASSGLSLATREAALKGGNRGPALDADSPRLSRIVEAVKQTGELKMPPGGKLTGEQIAAIETWVAQGAPWFAAETKPAGKKEQKQHWAFLAPVRAQAPQVRKPGWPRNPVDQFVLARLEKEKLAPSPEAEKATLARRVFLDLTGMPPTPEQAAEYLNDPRPDAYERLVDRLLASPHYGERWAQHWLDQARYADSDGGSRDEPRQVWKYRDWVIASLNRDQPFDEFVRDQIAGDLLPGATTEQIIATGFNRLHPIQIEAGTDREQYRVENVFDRVETMATVLLGLSAGCARCHDHKYDPISQREFYELYAYFNSVDEYGPDKEEFAKSNNLEDVHSPLLYLADEETMAKRNALRAQVKALRAELAAFQKETKAKADSPEVKARQEVIAQLVKQTPAVATTMVMKEMARPRPSYIMLGGDFLRRGVSVEPGYLRALNAMPETSGRRRNRADLAAWLTSAENPLVARVAVNRIWQQYFGSGIVETENDFGTQGSAPSHRELLDWLAVEFQENAWSRKRIHRLIVTSATYRQSSKYRPELEEIDPANRLLARQNRVRLDAEAIRDSALVASRLMAERIGGPSVFPPQPENAMAASQIKKVWTASTGADRYRRGMYTFKWRITPHPAAVVFDAPLANGACTRRPRSNTPLQALTLLNDEAYHEFAVALGAQMEERAAANRAEAIAHGFRLGHVRSPSEAEVQRLERLFSAEVDAFSSKPDSAGRLAAGATPPRAAWIALARVLLNTDEFVTRE